MSGLKTLQCGRLLWARIRASSRRPTSFGQAGAWTAPSHMADRNVTLNIFSLLTTHAKCISLAFIAICCTGLKMQHWDWKKGCSAVLKTARTNSIAAVGWASPELWRRFAPASDTQTLHARSSTLALHAGRRVC